MSDREKLIELLNDAGEMLAVDEAVAAELSGCENGWIKDKIGFIADYLIANGVTVQKWILVSERLPEENKPPKAYCDTVQVLLESGTVTVGWCNRYLGKWFYLPYGETRFANSIIGYPPVVAWKPLSEPPKECE